MADNIAQFNTPIDQLRPSEIGADALARAGRNIGSEYRQIGQDYQQAIDRSAGPVAKIVDQHDTMQEISHGSAALAAMHNNFTTQWNEMASKSDPNDKSIQGKFLNDTVEPQLQQFQDSFQTEKGQQWALAQTDAMRSHYGEKTSADMSARAGNAVVQNMKTTLNNLSDAARKDPSSMDASIGQIDALVAATKEHNSGTLSVEQIDKIGDIAQDMKKEVVKSGLQGLADVNPKAAIAAVNSDHFKDYVSGTEGDSLLKYAEGVTRMKLEDQSRAYENQKRAQEQRDEKAANTVINGMYNPDTGQLTVPDNINTQIWSMPGVSSKAKLQMLSAAKHISQESIIDDPEIIKGFAGRLKSDSSAPLTQDDLLNQVSQGKMTPSMYNFFNERIQNKPDTKAENEMISQTLSQWKNNILKPTFGQPNTPAAEQAYTRFQTWFLPAYQAALKDPSMQGMTNAQKAQTLLNPDSPKYMLGPETMKKFMASGNDIIPGMVGAGVPLPTGKDRTPLDQIFGPK